MPREKKKRVKLIRSPNSDNSNNAWNVNSTGNVNNNNNSNNTGLVSPALLSKCGYYSSDYSMRIVKRTDFNLAFSRTCYVYGSPTG